MMLRLILAVVLLATCVPSFAAAQNKPRVVTPTPVQPARTQESLASTRRLRGRDVNVQIELTITDFVGAAAPDKKVVSVTTADATMGRIRTATPNTNTELNIDATPSLLSGDRILLQLTVEYAPPASLSTPATGPLPRRATVNEMLSVVLQDGKSMMVSQAADPTTDRRMTVEVKATILK
jgi:hypothetical protein